MLEHDNQAVMDNDTYGHGHAVHHGSGLYREIHKDAADKGEIGVPEIQIIIMEKLRCLLRVTSTSLFLHPPHSLKGLLNQHEDYDKGSLNDMEVSRDEESNKPHILKEQQLLVVNAADKEASHEDDFENEDCSNLQALEDVNLTAKEDANEVNLKNQKSTDVIDVQNGSSFKDVVDFDKKEKLKYAFDGYTINQDLPNELMIDYSQWIAVGLLKTHSAKYTMISHFLKTYVEKTHTRYYPAEPAIELSTQQDYAELIVVARNEDAIANIIHEFCMSIVLPWYMVDEVYVPINCGKEFYWVLIVIVFKERLIHVYGSLTSKRKKEPPIEIQKLAVMLPTYLLDNGFYDKTERTDWPSFEAYKGKITQQIGLINEIPFDVDYVQNIPQQASDSLNCGIFVCAYAEILSEGLQVHSCGFDAASQRAHYASLLWHYRVEKAPGATRSYHTVSLEIDNWKIERWSDTVPSRCPFLRDLELWCNAGEIALRYWKKDNSKFECWHDAS
ncbi:hypothetical protein FXO37_11652 [Capsicum annuum]|nr:hypothetical protein FXO37_11652 [Capsicum annuum]